MNNIYKNFHLKRDLNNSRHKFTNRTSVNKALKLRPAIFFDRDGVIIEDVHYISNPKDVKILNGVKNILDISIKYGWVNIIVTNQSGISKGFLNWEKYEEITERMLESLASNYFTGIYASGDGSGQTLSKKSWRKPNPNMIFSAAADFNLDLSSSILIGDRLTDLIAAKNAGISTFIHVLTGHGKQERNSVINRFGNKKNDNLILIDDLSNFPIRKIFKKNLV